MADACLECELDLLLFGNSFHFKDGEHVDIASVLLGEDGAPVMVAGDAPGREIEHRKQESPVPPTELYGRSPPKQQGT